MPTNAMYQWANSRLNSDHAPLEIILELKETRWKRKFQFEEMWFERIDCFDIIKNAWCSVGQTRELEDLK